MIPLLFFVTFMTNITSESHPIGVFDSGYGGLTILKEFVKVLPQYDFIYLGDNARSPYGTRSFEAVYHYTLEAVKKLFSMGCHLIILACNTASAKALRSIQQNNLPGIDPNKRVLGVIRPSAEAINFFTKTRHIGVLGTVGTVVSESYPIEINKLYPDIITIQEACPMWVPLVENNEYSGEGADYFVEKNIINLLEKDTKIDTVILGCTHYPLLIDKINKYLPKNITLISQGEIISASLKNYLKRHPEIDIHCTKLGIHRFYTTDSVEFFDRQASIFYDRPINAEHIVL
jgi:glutamate racemase